MPLYWFKGPVGEPFQFQCGADGINIPRLADKVKLKVSPLELNGVVVDFDSSSGYLSLQDAQEFIQGLGGSTETAIPVDGQPAGAAAGGTAAPAAAGVEPQVGLLIKQVAEEAAAKAVERTLSSHEHQQHQGVGGAGGAGAGGADPALMAVLKPLQQLILAMSIDQFLPPMSQASSASQGLRPNVLAAYNADGTQEQWCVASGLWWPALAAESCPYIRAAHIMPRRTPRTQWLALGLGLSPDVLQNVVPMMAAIEWAFDDFRLCVVPSAGSGPDDVHFVIHILDPDLNNKQVYASFISRSKQNRPQWTPPSPRQQERQGLGAIAAADLTFGQLHLQQLQFRGQQRPARRCFTFHAFLAVQSAQKAGWDVGGLQIDETHCGWMSPTFEDKLRNTSVWAMQATVQSLAQQSPHVENAGSGGSIREHDTLDDADSEASEGSAEQ